MVYPNYGRFLQPGEGKSSRDLKEKLALVCRVLGDGGILPSVFGHCSVRIPGGTRIYIQPHVHWQRKVVQEVTADDICTMDLDGNPIDCDSIDIPEERFFHTEVYKARADIGAVVYGHPRMSGAFAEAGRDTLSVFGYRVPVIPNPGFGSALDKGQAVAKGLGAHRAVAWPSGMVLGVSGVPSRGPGGTVVVGKDIEEACMTAFALEREAEKQLFMVILGGPPKSEAMNPSPDMEKLIASLAPLQFQYFAAMDRGPRKQVNGALFWS